MIDDAKGEVEIYEYFSECLRVFMKKMALITKIANSDSDSLTLKLKANLDQVIHQATIMLSNFDELPHNNSKNQPIFSRFALRVRESVHNFYLKTSSLEIVNYLKFIQSIIKQFLLNSNMKSLLKIILLKIPTNLVNQLHPRQNLLKDQRPQVLGQKISESKSVLVKNQSHFDIYDRYLEALNRQYRLFDCLNLEEAHYRRTFFTAIEDHNRRNNNLFEDMMERNRYTNQSLKIYQKQFESKKKKIQERREKLLKTQVSLFEIKSRRAQADIVTIYKQKPSSISPEKFSAPKRMKTDYDSKIQQNNQIPLLLGAVHNFHSKKYSHSFKQPLKTPNSMLHYSSSFQKQDSFQKTRVSQFERQSIKNVNFIPLKKVQFRGTRIQLAPEEIEKKPTLLKDEDRRRRLNSRTNEHLRKKITFITQPRTQKQIQFPLCEYTSSKEEINFQNIRINNCKIDK